MDVTGNVLAGMGEAKELMDRFNAVGARAAEELAMTNERGDRRAGGASGKDRRHRRLGPRAQGRDRDGRAPCPGRRSDVTKLSAAEAPGRLYKYF